MDASKLYKKFNPTMTTDEVTELCRQILKADGNRAWAIWWAKHDGWWKNEVAVPQQLSLGVFGDQDLTAETVSVLDHDPVISEPLTDDDISVARKIRSLIVEHRIDYQTKSNDKKRHYAEHIIDKFEQALFNLKSSPEDVVKAILTPDGDFKEEMLKLDMAIDSEDITDSTLLVEWCRRYYHKFGISIEFVTNQPNPYVESELNTHRAKTIVVKFNCVIN